MFDVLDSLTTSSDKNIGNPEIQTCQEAMKRKGCRLDEEQFVVLNIFCSTSLLLASTRYVRSTFSSLCLLSSNQINLSSIEINFWECQELNPGPLGEKQLFYLCAMQPTLVLNSLGTEASRRTE